MPETSFDTTAADLSAGKLPTVEATPAAVAVELSTSDPNVTAAVRAVWALCAHDTAVPVEVHVAQGDTWAVVRVAVVVKAA